MVVGTMIHSKSRDRRAKEGRAGKGSTRPDNGTKLKARLPCCHRADMHGRRRWASISEYQTLEAPKRERLTGWLGDGDQHGQARRGRQDDSKQGARLANRQCL